jgi:hypothetical protein
MSGPVPSDTVPGPVPLNTTEHVAGSIFGLTFCSAFSKAVASTVKPPFVSATFSKSPFGSALPFLSVLTVTP